MKPDIPRVAQPAPSCVTVDARDAVALALAAIEPALRRAVRRVTTNLDLADDLLQEARICLWEMDPTRYDLQNAGDLRYVCRALSNRMWSGLRAELKRGVG